MTDRISFHAGSECGVKLGELCPLCNTQRVMLAYSIFSPARKQETGEGQTIEGFCCLGCGQQLLASLEEIARAKRQMVAGQRKALLKGVGTG